MKSFFSTCGEVVPVLENVRRPGFQLRVGRDHAEFLLVLEDLIAHLVPALVKEMQLADLVDPFLGRMMRRVRGARRVLDEERLARHRLVDAVQVIDRIVGHAGDEIPFRLAGKGIDLRRVAEQIRLPLIRVAADEAVEVFKAHPGWPLVERADLAGGERGVL